MRLSGTTIGFMASNPLEDKRAYSGTMYSMAKALEGTGAKVVRIPVDSSSLLRKLYLKAVKEVERFIPPLKGRLSKRLVWKSRIAARKLDMSIIEKCDVIFAPMHSGTLFSLKTSKPIVYLSDATFHAMIDYYWFDIPNDIANDFYERVSFIFEEIDANIAEIRTLTQQRDELLPLLMNGQATLN